MIYLLGFIIGCLVTALLKAMAARRAALKEVKNLEAWKAELFKLLGKAQDNNSAQWVELQASRKEVKRFKDVLKGIKQQSIEAIE